MYSNCVESMRIGGLTREPLVKAISLGIIPESKEAGIEWLHRFGTKQVASGLCGSDFFTLFWE